MNSRRIVIHVGAPKTGTTAIQSSLYRGRDFLLREARVLYPTAGVLGKGQSGHHNLVYEIAPGLRKAGKFEAQRGGWAEVYKQIEEAEVNTAIVSAEGLFRRARQLSRGLKRFRRYHIEIVFYLRRQDEYLESGYNQLARFARVDDDIRDFIVRRGQKIIDYQQIVQSWRTYFPGARIHCTPFQKHIIGENVLHDFARRVIGGISPPLSSTGNPRAGLKTIRAAYFVRNQCRAALGPSFGISGAIASEIRKLFSEAFADIYSFSFLEPNLARRILREAEPTNRWLASQFPEFDPEFFFETTINDHGFAQAASEVHFNADERDALDAIVARLLTKKA